MMDVHMAIAPISLRLMMSQFNDITNRTQVIEVSKMHILRCMGTTFCVRFQRCLLNPHNQIAILRDVNLTNFDILYNIWVVCVQLAHFSSKWLKGYIYNSCYHHHEIGSIHLSHCYHIFPGCVPEMFVISYSVTYCIYVPGKLGICFHYHCAWWVQIFGCALACRSYSFVCTVHHLIIIIVQAYLKALNL